MNRLSDTLNAHPATRPAPCPHCGRPSRSVQLVPDGPWGGRPCAQCLDREAKAEAERVQQQLRIRHQAACDRAVEALGVPPLYAGATFASFDVSLRQDPTGHKAKALEWGREFVASWGTPSCPAIAVLMGGPGTGKGHLTWAIAREVAGRHAANVVVAVLSDIVRDLRDAWQREEGTESARLARYRQADLLIVDEVSKHAFYGRPTQHLYDLIDHREKHLRPTILTTNDRGAELADTLGPALCSRCLRWNADLDLGDADYRLGQRRGA